MKVATRLLKISAMWSLLAGPAAVVHAQLTAKSHAPKVSLVPKTADALQQSAGKKQKNNLFTFDETVSVKSVKVNTLTLSPSPKAGMDMKVAQERDGGLTSAPAPLKATKDKGAKEGTVDTQKLSSGGKHDLGIQGLRGLTFAPSPLKSKDAKDGIATKAVTPTLSDSALKVAKDDAKGAKGEKVAKSDVSGNEIDVRVSEADGTTLPPKSTNAKVAKSDVGK